MKPSFTTFRKINTSKIRQKINTKKIRQQKIVDRCFNLPVVLMGLWNLLSDRGGWGTSPKKKVFLCDVFISILHMPFPLVLDTGLYFGGVQVGTS